MELFFVIGLVCTANGLASFMIFEMPSTGEKSVSGVSRALKLLGFLFVIELASAANFIFLNWSLFQSILAGIGTIAGLIGLLHLFYIGDKYFSKLPKKIQDNISLVVTTLIILAGYTLIIGSLIMGVKK